MTAEALVLGGGGQLGRELARTPPPAGWTVRAVPRAAADITDPGAIGRLLDESPRARAVINAAAYTAVDRAESDREAAFAVNARAPGMLAAACAARDLPLVHVSTDYVFDGENERPWREDDAIAPLGVYGESKAAGEDAVRRACERHVIVRTSWVFGALGANFVRTMLRLAGERPLLTVVDDQTGCPTWTGNLARVLLEIAGQAAAGDPARFGTFHYADEGPVTWCGFARAIFERAGRLGLPVPEVRPIATADYPTPARRPRYSVLSTDKIESSYGIARGRWSEGLDRSIAELLGQREN